MLMAEPGSEGDWTHVYLKDPATAKIPKPIMAAFASFQASLKAISSDCQQYNEQANARPFPDGWGLYCFDPANLECSVSV